MKRPRLNNRGIIIKEDVAHYYENMKSIDVYIWHKPEGLNYRTCASQRIPIKLLEQTLKRIKAVQRYNKNKVKP